MSKDIKTVPRNIRFQVGILAKGAKKAKSLGLKLPAYINMLIAKDTEDK